MGKYGSGASQSDCVITGQYGPIGNKVFDSCKDMVTETPIVIRHFGRFGMEIHQGNQVAKKKSMSEALFVAKPITLHEDPDTYDGEDLSDIDLGNGLFIPIVALFIYLGSMI